MASPSKIPFIDLSADTARQTIIAAGTAEVYQGHPTTVLTRAGKLLCVWTTGHGGPCGPAAESLDGGRTWTRIDGRLPPEYGAECRNCPTLQKMVLPDGRERILVFSARPPNGDHRNCDGICPLGIAYSDDDGVTWRMAPPAEVSAMMPPTGFIQLTDGSVALFGQVFKSLKRAKDRPTDDQNVWMATSPDGLSWSPMRIVASAPEKNLCEPFAIRSPDGREIALLLRENRHTGCSMMVFSQDEGRTWTAPVDTAPELTGDRHEGVVLPDGRLFIAFRDRRVVATTPSSSRDGGGAVATSTYGHYVAWVGTWDDLRMARPGQCRVKLLHSHAGEEGLENAAWKGDTGYSGVELLPNRKKQQADNSKVSLSEQRELLCTTYIKYWADARCHSVVCTRLRIEELTTNH